MSKESQNLSPEEIVEITRRSFARGIQEESDFYVKLERYKSNLENMKDGLNPTAYKLLNELVDEFMKGHDPSSVSHGGDKESLSEDIT